MIRQSGLHGNKEPQGHKEPQGPNCMTREISAC